VLAIEVWQVKSGTIFDNIMITDDEAEAKAFGEETWKALKEAETEMKDKLQKEKDEKAKAEADAKKDEDEEAEDEEEKEEEKDEL